MPNALDTRSLPTAVGVLPTPVEITPGTFLIVTAPEEADHPLAGPFRQARVQPTVRIERRSTRDSPWHGLPSIPTALRARTRREPGDWTPLTSSAESKLHQELLSYALLGDNWDGNGAKAPSQGAVNDALTFLDGRPGDIPLPYPEEGTDGDVGVYWDFKHAQVFTEVIFEGDGTCAYFAVRGLPRAVAEKYGNDGVDVAGPWPDDLLRILRTRDPT